MVELTERLEKATGPDRELDCLIFESQHKLLTPERRGSIDGEPTGEYYGLNGDQLPERAPFYTSSIDAALTLVPNPNLSRPLDIRVRLTEAGHSYVSFENWLWGNEHTSGPRAVANPAIAICIAALKARQPHTAEKGFDDGNDYRPACDGQTCPWATERKSGVISKSLRCRAWQ